MAANKNLKITYVACIQFPSDSAIRASCSTTLPLSCFASPSLHFWDFLPSHHKVFVCSLPELYSFPPFFLVNCKLSSDLIWRGNTLEHTLHTGISLSHAHIWDYIMSTSLTSKLCKHRLIYTFAWWLRFKYVLNKWHITRNKSIGTVTLEILNL